MGNQMRKSLNQKAHLIPAGVVLLVALITYGITVAPTVSFWDCGEFIACAYTLGIPHPPGAPLFILLGKFFSLVIPFGEVALRVNLISVLSSTLTVLFFYLILVRIINSLLRIKDLQTRRWFSCVGGLVGSLFLTFSDTFWFNAVEAEVYGLAMFFMVFICWLTLLWAEKFRERESDRLLFLVVYLLFLGITDHMTVFLVAPPVALFLVLVDRKRFLNWRFLLLAVLLATVVVSIDLFLVFCVGALVLILSLQFFGSREINYHWKFWGVAILLALLGYSTYIYVPIRSHLNPAIDENDPENWTRFKMFLERKQYGQESMFKRMLHRRGSWAHQFGDYPRMGFWGFFKGQYIDERFWVFPVLLGLLGLYTHWTRERRTALFFTSLFLLASVGLVVYINFSDGTRGEPLEVRDRDYFFAPAFTIFPLWLGIGAAGVLEWLLGQKVPFKKLTCGAAMAGLVAFSTVPLWCGFHEHDRTGNYIPYDYAYNLLNSCGQNAILFTNGDNDTFPLWFLQEVEGIRRDVRVANLSLLNTEWYIKQLRDRSPQVPISLSDERIEQLRPFRLSQESKIDLAGITYHAKRDQVFRVQDVMVLDIIRTNAWQRPIYFAVTVSEENKIGLQDHLRMEGMVYRLVREKGKNMVDPERSHHLLWEVYRYRGVNDPRVYKDENTRKLLTNYRAAFMTLALAYHRQGKNEEAIRELERCKQVTSLDWRGELLMSQLYTRLGKFELAVERLRRVVAAKPDLTVAQLNLGLLLARTGQQEEAVDLLENLIAFHPNLVQAYQGLISIYDSQGEYAKVAQVIQRWLAQHPKDSLAQKMLREYQSKIAQP